MSKVSCTVSYKGFEPNASGYQAVMKSSAAGSACDAAAQTLVNTANATKKRGTYEVVTSIVHGDRRVALAHTGDYEAIIDENKRKTLSRLVS